MGRPRVADADRVEAKRILLAWLAAGDDDLAGLQQQAFELHVKQNTFPGDEFTRLAVRALDAAQVSNEDSIAYQTLLTDFLPEVEFRGKENRKIRFTVMSVASLRGGVDPDVLDEIIYWNDDYWLYCLWASIALGRAAAAKAGTPVTDLARRLAAEDDLDLSD